MLKNKSKYILILLIFFASFLHANSSCIKGDVIIKSIIKKDFDIDTLKISGAFNLHIKSADKSYLKIKAEKNILDFIDAKIKNKILDISTKGAICPTKDIDIELFVPNIENLYAQGSSAITLNIKDKKMFIKLEGVHEIKGKGVIDELKLDLGGSNEIDFFALKTENITLNSEGICDAKFYSTKNIRVLRSEILNIAIKGGGKIKKETK